MQTSNTTSNEIVEKHQEQDNPDTATAKKNTTLKHTPWLTLLIAMVILGGGAWLFWLQPLSQPKQSVVRQGISSTNTITPPPAMVKINDVHHDTSAVTSSIEQNTTVPLPTPNKEPSTEKHAPLAANDLAPTALPKAPKPNIVQASKSDQVEISQTTSHQPSTIKWHQELTQLHAEITTLQTAIAMLRRQQAAQQRQQFVNSLNQLLSPGTPLSQQVMLWQSMANEQQLSIAQQQQAAIMATLAKQNMAAAGQWSITLQDALLSLHVKTPINIIPHDYWWQKWISEHVSLYRQPSPHHQQHERIKYTAEKIIARLSQDEWPDDRIWQSLLKQIPNHPLVASLSHTIAVIEKNRTAMRHLAEQWKEQAL